MNITVQLWLSFVVCLISAGIGMCLAINRKGIGRGKMENVAIWVFLGFTSFLLVLMANAVSINLSYLDDVLIGMVYGYFMADASIFETKR